MPCYHPLRGWKGPGGKVVFRRESGWSDRPVDLPCGQCLGCRIQRSADWALRCVHEAQMHLHNSFVTLTYDQEHLPSDGSLRLEDWQKFAKRVRKELGPFRFFHCGEYGEKNQRPHYHALLFGLDFRHDRVSYSQTLYGSRTLDRLWGQGFTSIGNLTYESAAYVARYVMKKLTGSQAEERYTRMDKSTGEFWSVKPEYCTMSRRPGIGSGWLEEFYEDVFPSDEVVHSGRRHRVPRFYDDSAVRFGVLSETGLDELKAERRARVAVRSMDLTAKRLEVRERVVAAKLRQKEREL